MTKNQEIQHLNLSYKISRFLKSCESYPKLIKRTFIEAYMNSTYDLMVLRIPIKKAHHERNPKNWLEKRNFREHSEWSSGDVYIHEIWRWIQWDYSCDLIRSISWRFWDSHKNDAKSWSRTAQIFELEKKQGQIGNQRPLKRLRQSWTSPFFFYLMS